jgi:hypothetical protein
MHAKTVKRTVFHMIGNARCEKGRDSGLPAGEWGYRRKYFGERHVGPGSSQLTLSLEAYSQKRFLV